MELENLLQAGSKKLKDSGVKTYLLDSEILLSSAMKISKNDLFFSKKNKISKKIYSDFWKFIKRRSNHEPIAYILKKKEFWSIDFFVKKGILIPRPETELMVEEIVKIYKKDNPLILDIGTGTGCILLSLVKEFSKSTGLGIDISKKAINVAKKNSIQLKLNNRAFFKVCDLKDLCQGKYDILVSNPPYIAQNELKELSEDIKKFEPIKSLNGGIDGLDLIRKVIYKSKYLLKTGGFLAIELGNSQYHSVSKLMARNGYREVGKVFDYQDNVRCIISTNLLNK